MESGVDLVGRWNSKESDAVSSWQIWDIFFSFWGLPLHGDLQRDFFKNSRDCSHLVLYILDTRRAADLEYFLVRAVRDIVIAGR